MMNLFGAPAEARDAIAAAYAADYARSEALWKGLEAKAQGTITVAGLFAGFALNYAKELGAGAHWAVRALTVLTVGLLSACVVYAALALRVTGVALPPGGPAYQQIANSYSALPESERAGRVTSLEENVLILWRDAVAALNRAARRKGVRVGRSQALLFAAIVTSALLAGATVLLPAPPPGPTASQGGPP